MNSLHRLSDWLLGLRPFHKTSRPRRGKLELGQDPKLLYEECLATGRSRPARFQYPLREEVRHALQSIECASRD